MDWISKLSATPLPNILVIAGVVFLLLAVAGKVGAHLSVPPTRQKASALIGLVLLVSGIAMFMVPKPIPPIEGQLGTVNDTTFKQFTVPQNDVKTHTEELKPKQQNQEDSDISRHMRDASHQMLEASIKVAINRAYEARDNAEIELNPRRLEGFYDGEALKNETQVIERLKRDKNFKNCTSERQYQKIDIDKNRHQASVQMTETRDCAYYHVGDRHCLSQYEKASDFDETLFLTQKNSNWFINLIRTPSLEGGGEPALAFCNDNKWPSKLD